MPAIGEPSLPGTEHRVEELWACHRQEIYKRSDRLFAWLLPLQWMAGVVAALWISPRTWDGPASSVHPHVWAALLLGSLMTVWPVYNALVRPGTRLTRHTIAIAQMLMSSLLIHLSGGRIETHFHIFGSLAFLAFYRDWRLIASASALVIADHVFRGIYLPQSIFGVLSISPARWIEHTGWVLFLDVFLFISIRQSCLEMLVIAQRQATLEALNNSIEQRVAERTNEWMKEHDRHEKVQRDLQQLQGDYELVVNSIAEGIHWIDREGIIIYENPAAAQLLGWEASDLIGRPAHATMHHTRADGTSYPQCECRIHLGMETGKRCRVDDEVFCRKDGSTFPVEYTSTPVRNQAGEIIGSVVVFNDVTARRKAQEEFCRTQAMLQTIVDHLPQRVFLKSTDLTFIACNRAFAHDTGLASPADVVGKTDFELVWTTDAERYRADDIEVIRSGIARSQYAEVQRRTDGSTGWLRTSKVPVRDAEGHVFAVLGTYEDITEIQRADTALQESEERFRLGFEFAGIGMALVSLQGHWLKVNQKICEIVGYSEARLLEITFQEITHPEDLEGDLALVSRLISGELRSYQIEKRYIHKKGHIVSTLLTASIVRNSGGDPLYFISQVEDISERKRHEALQKEMATQLAGERRRLADILNSVPAVVFETHKPMAGNSGADFVSNYVQTIYGFSAEEWLATPGFSLSRVHPDDRQRVVDVALEVFAGRLAESQLLFRLLARDGRTVWGETHLVAMRDAADELIGMRGVTLDVSARMRAQEELERKTALLEAQVDSTLDGTLVVDMDGKQILQSRQFVKMWNIPTEILAQQDDMAVVQFVLASTKDPAGFLEKVTYLNSHPNETSRDEIELADGSVLDRYTAPVVGKDNTYYGRIWTFRDITEQKRAESEMQRMHKQLLDVSRQAGMTEVASSVLHNVGNVLNSVNVSCAVISDKVRRSRIVTVSKTADLLQSNEGDLSGFFSNDPAGIKLPGFLSRLAQKLVEEQSAVLNELALLARNIEHIKEIVAMQQSYANVAGVKEILPLAGLVEDALQMHGAALNRHQLDVVREFGEVPPVCVEKHKVLQILVNLVQNAKHALSESRHGHKQLVLRIALAGSDRVAVSVSDNGIGIPAENLTRIFGHGFTTKKEGHGFGLHSGVLAAQQMGGTLRVQSEGAGLGATFTLELPISDHGIKQN
ncbi:MAG: sensor signal transduction histidine kinase [Chthoniobacteraceae bacterium]|nr:sensor signal transduction histidine kinase [Chthoniobacteraceae bacterium]